MLLLVGLGNPGPEHQRQRHNIGFMAIDAIAERYNFAPFRKRFQGELAEGVLDGIKTLLLKPQTYMNLSGKSVGEAAHFYKLPPAQVVVLHDELDLAPGKLRVKLGGGHAGHNGLRSVDAAIGADYRRVRLGIGHPGKEQVLGFVLQNFSKVEQDWLNPLLEAIADAAPALARGDDVGFMNKVALKLTPPRNDPPKKDSPPKNPLKGAKPKEQ
ncbi:aminoacyl-tRNA hydrolase [Ferrovibrio sp. MS7]|uniref:aminoacyl-tRNA hydrolase n=1 Tax=Ferrovibrio plantarum TaxID=3119164 RepID=UPI001B66FEB5|nr:aminoacyl-tRNA hydrolase [Ferrovibrio sp.]